jgi:hypothetical protein
MFLQQSDSQAVNLLDGRNMLPPQKDDINSSLPPVSATPCALVLASQMQYLPASYCCFFEHVRARTEDYCPDLIP